MTEPQPSSGADRLDRIVEKLTFTRVVLAFLAAATYFVFEHRDTVFPAIAGNTAASLGLAIGFGLLGVGLVGNAMLGRMDKKGEALEGFMRDDLRESRDRMDRMQADLDTARAEIGDVRANERRCQALLRHANRELVRLGGDPPDQSLFGDF